MNAAPLRPLSTGEVLDVAFSLYRRHFTTLALIAVLSQVVGLVFAVYVQASGGLLQNGLLYLLSMVVTTICAAIGMGASTKIVADSYLGRSGTAGEALRWVLPHTGKLIVVTFLASIAMFFGFLLLIIPGVIIACGLAVSVSALVVEGLNPMDALNRSWNLTKEHRGRVFGVVAVAMILMYLVSIAAGFVAAMFGWAAGSGEIGAFLALMIVSGVLTALVYPFVYCAVTVLYYDLRVRKEGFDLEVLESQLAAS